MTHQFALLASDFTGANVVCEFTATADTVTRLTAKDLTQPIFDIPPDAKTVEVTFKPQGLRGDPFWEGTFIFSVAPDGSLIAPVDFPGRVVLTTPVINQQAGFRFSMAVLKVSQFRDRTKQVFELLKSPPAQRRIFDRVKKDWVVKDVDEAKKHKGWYGPWPGLRWELPDAPGVRYIDAGTPLTSSLELNFARDASLHLTNVKSVVLERKGVRKVPQYFAVTWPPPKSVAPRQFLLFIRQYLKYNGYDLAGLFTKTDGHLAPYADSFDYADSCLFESVRYARSPFWNPNAKGVPYQVAKARADVVTVVPCNDYTEGFGDLADPEDAETVLKEIQAFMFWSGGTTVAPTSIGNTAVAAFSAGNFFLGKWLKDDKARNGHFLHSVVRAIYFLEPMRSYTLDGKTVQVLDEFVASALKWAGEGDDKRIRVYMQFPWPSLQKLIPDNPLGSPPFFKPSSDGTRTVSVVTNPTWTKAWNEAWIEAFRKPPPKQPSWLDIHHAICATMLTHALSQGDFEFV